MQAIILSAGKGKRLKPFTNIRSKAMAPILNVPIVFRVMQTFWESGVKDFVVVKSPDDIFIKDYIQSNKPNNIRVDFVNQENRNGMAGAVLEAKDLIKKDFIVSACDSLKPHQYIKNFVNTFTENDHNALIAVMKSDKKSITKSSAVELSEDGYIKKIIEKPSISEINTNLLGLPLFAFKFELLKHLDEVEASKRGEKELQKFVNIIIQKYGNVHPSITESRYTITNTRDLVDVNITFLNKTTLKKFEIKKEHEQLHIRHPVIIGNDLSFGEECYIGPNVIIEDNVTLGDNVRISNSLILSESNIPNNSIINNELHFTTDN